MYSTCNIELWVIVERFKYPEYKIHFETKIIITAFWEGFDCFFFCRSIAGSTKKVDYWTVVADVADVADVVGFSEFVEVERVVEAGAVDAADAAAAEEAAVATDLLVVLVRGAGTSSIQGEGSGEGFEPCDEVFK